MMREVETQPVGGDERPFLLHVLSQHFPQRCVQEMRRGMIQDDRRPPLSIDSRVQRVAHLDPALRHLAREPLEYIASLADAGLAEMRALIFELRPESLRLEGLTAAIRKQTESLRVRHGIAVVGDLGEEPDVPLDVKEALYRVSQEALHNVVKHARASQVQIGLVLAENSLTLSIEDDGIGFDVEGEFPGHLGLQSMRERVQELGGEFRLDSRPGGGARIEARVPVGED